LRAGVPLSAPAHGRPSPRRGQSGLMTFAHTESRGLAIGVDLAAGYQLASLTS
jgi:hypothetical protein